ncbi:MAG: sulfatase [Anaerolineales bacterium]|nr:sulfatase [Anaerolineales bacterium]
MNLIVLCIDSLRQDHVSFYNPDSPVETTNIDRVAARSAAFDNVYPEALPTIPIRTALMTGQRTLTSRPWKPLNRDDHTIVDLLAEYGYRSALIADTYHYFKPGYNFHRGFDVWRWIRGQEYDPFRSAALKRYKLEDHINENYPPDWPPLVEASLKNLEPLREPEEYFAPQVIHEAMDWLEANKDRDQLFLWMDCFDPHEPWWPPEKFNNFTDPDYRGKQYLLPPGGQAANYFDQAEIEHIRGLYAGEVAMVDHYLGELFDAMERWGLFENSVVLFLADHGHPLADHGKFLKGPDRMYSELLKVPAFIHFPGGEWGGTRSDALGLFHDLPVTLLDALGLGNNAEAFQGHSLLPLVRGERDSIRESIITGFHEGIDRCIRDRRWSYIRRPPGQKDELYDLKEDPRETNNLISDRPEVAERLASQHGLIYETGRAAHGVMGEYETEGTAAGAASDRLDFHDDGTGAG